MNGYGSHRSRTAKTFSAIQMITMMGWMARSRPVPRNRAKVSAVAPTASGLKRRIRLSSRRPPLLGMSSRGASATAGTLPPVFGQQVVEDVVDAHGADQPALGVHHRCRDQVVGGEVAGHLGQRRLRGQRLEIVEDAADQGRR